MKIVGPQQRLKISIIFIGKFVLILHATIFLFLFHFSTTASAFKEEKKKILILFTAQSDTPAYTFIEKGIKQALEATRGFRFEYFIEYMDRYRNTDQTYYSSCWMYTATSIPAKQSIWWLR